MSDDAKITPATPPASNGPSGGPPEPFVRKQVTWGRMPTTTFHVGPVPVAPNPLDRIPNRPPRTTPLGQTGPSGGQVSGQVQEPPRRVPAPRAGGNILSGSLIPQTRPRSGPVTPAPQPKPAPAPAPSADTTVRPLPGAGLTNAPSAPVDQPDVAEQVAAAPVVAAPALAPLEPSPAVEAAPSVTPSFARAATRRPSRLPLYIGVGVLAVLAVGGGLWFALRPAPVAAPVAPAPAAAPEAVAPEALTPAAAPVETPVETAAPVEAAPVEETPAGAAVRPAAAPAPTTARTTPQTTGQTTARTSSARPATTTRPQTPAQSTTQTPAPRVPTAQAPAAVSTPPSATPAPVVVVAPAPTAARPAQTDPNAPVVTRPQPLD